MQIHELNNYAGALGSGSFLAIDNGTDTGKISSQQLLAPTEARIDNIIAGDAPSAAEVTDARFGSDGVTYTSLGTAIRTQVSDLKADIGTLAEVDAFAPAFSWEVGALNVSNGTTLENNEYIRTTDYYHITDISKMTVKNNGNKAIRVSVVIYNEAHVYVQRYGNQEYGYNKGESGTFNFSSTAGYIKIHIRYQPKENMSASYANDIGFTMNTKATLKFSDLVNNSLQSSTIAINNSTYTSYPDANNLTPNRAYSVSSAITSGMVANLPVYGVAGVLLYYVVTPTAKNGVQLYNASSAMYYRYTDGNGAGTWKEIETRERSENAVRPSQISINSDNYSSYADADDYIGNRIYAISSTITSAMVDNLPLYDRGAFLIYLKSGSASPNGVQLYFGINGEYYYRVITSTAGEWINGRSESLEPVFDIQNYFVHTCVDKPITLDSSTGLFIFGDSITTTTHGGFTWGSLLATKTGCTEHNYGVGSAAFGYDSNSIISQVNGVSDWSDCDVCIIAAGTNDANYNTSASKLRASVTNVISAIQTNAPNAKIIFITPLQRAQSNYNEKLPEISGAICNVALENGCSVINGFEIPIPCYGNDWIDELTDNDGLHPASIGKRIYAQAILNAIL